MIDQQINASIRENCYNKGAPADREKVIKGWILHDVLAFIEFKKVVGVAAVMVAAIAAEAEAEALVSFSNVNTVHVGAHSRSHSLNRASKA